jgi:beta-lactamase superfamily II metal-dependent hydrolase
MKKLKQARNTTTNSGKKGAVLVSKATKAAKKTAKKMPIWLVVLTVLVVVALVIGVVWWFQNQPDNTETPFSRPDLGTPEGTLSIHFIDVGQGDAILIALPDGKFMLIDGGDNSNTISTALITYLDGIVGVGGLIDTMLLTHTDSDHVGGLDNVLDAFFVSQIYMPYLSASYDPSTNQDDYVMGSISTKVYYDFYTRAFAESYVDDSGQTQSAQIFYNYQEYFIAGHGYSITMFNRTKSYYENLNYANGNSDIVGDKAKDINNMSTIIVLEYAGVKVVLTGDADQYAENDFIADYTALYGAALDADILKVGHHGSADSNNQAFLNFIQVEYAIISVGEGNSYGHPTQSALNRLAGTTLYRTDQNGNIVLHIYDDGEFEFLVDKE